MSEFIAEAQVLVKPDTSKFRAQLQAQLLAATKGITVPVNIVGSGGGTADKAVAGLTARQQKLRQVAEETTGVLKAQATAAKGTTSALLGAGSATAKLDAGLLGLRTALGSTAVIGLGATSLAAIAAGKAIRSSLEDFSSFEQELATFRVTSEATAEQMGQVNAAAIRLGADIRLPGVSAIDAAVAMTELSKAGLTVQDALAGAEGVLQLATAAQISNADAALIAANALNSFGLAGENATEVADNLANAANASQGSIADIGIAMRQASAVARQVGLSFADTTSILALFAKNGLSGSDAGTSLRVALIRLVAPTKAAAAEIQKLGLQIRDAQGNFRADVFAQFGQATKDLGPAARDAAAALIFGQDAIRAVSIGAREGAAGLQVMRFEIDQQGTAAELAAARTEGLAGAFAALQSNAQNLGIALGKALSGPVADTARNFAIIFGVLESGIVKLGELNAKVPSGKDSFFGNLNDQINEFGKTNAVPGAAIVNVINQIRGIGDASDDQAERLKRLRAQIEGLQTARVSAARGGDIELAKTLTLQIERLKKQIQDVKREQAGIDIAGPFDKALDPLKKAVAEMEKVKNFRLDEGIVKSTPFLDQRIADLRAVIAEYESGLRGANREQANMVRGMNGVTTAADATAASINALNAALKNLKAQSFAANSELLKLQNEGAGPQAEIANLQNQRKIQEDIIANIKASGNQSGDATKINAAREEINRIQSQIDSLQSGIVADQKAAASEAEKKAKEAQEARDKQFQAIADMFGGRQEDIANKIERAGIAGNVAKELRLNQALIKSIKKELETLRERLRILKVSGEARKKILEAVNDALEEAQQDRLRLQLEVQENLFKRLDFRVSLAQARDNTAAEIKARRARLAAISAELARLKNAHKRNTDRWRELRLALAEEVAAIKELEGEQKEKKGAQKSFFFEFLQTQQGFAANLLGNLIPGFATGNLVGGSTPSAAAEPLRQVAGGFEQPRGAAATSAALSSGRERGVRPVQVDTTNHLLRQILRSLQNLNGRASHPEARHNKGTSSALMDTLGAMGD